jgi:hypothetical protein
MFGRLFRGKSRPRTGADDGPMPGPYAPLFDEPLTPAREEREEPREPPVVHTEAAPEPPAAQPVEDADLEPTEAIPPVVAPEPAVVESAPAVLATVEAERGAPAYEPLSTAGWAGLAARVEEPADEGAAGEEPSEPISAAEHAVIIDVMRVAPDVRYRAARSLDLLKGLEETHGIAREHAILERARSSGKLIPLAEAIAR